MDGSKSYSAWAAYGRSKLANGLFAAELSRRLKGTAVTANSLHPGVIKTNLGRHLGGPPRAADDDVFNKNIPQGAATQCYVAANPIPAGISGQYFSDCNPAMANKLMYDEALASKLWAVSEELIHKNQVLLGIDTFVPRLRSERRRSAHDTPFILTIFPDIPAWTTPA